MRSDQPNYLDCITCTGARLASRLMSAGNTGILLVVWLQFILITGCAYRFSNLHIRKPDKIESIAFESVYDTSGQVVPHEHFWQELQRAFAANGHLKVTSVAEADALLRAHLRQVNVTKSGDRIDRFKSEKRGKKDPDLYVGQGEPRDPSEFRDLTTSYDYYAKDSTSYELVVEIYNLKTRSLILQRSYGGSIQPSVIRGGVPDELVFLRHEEAEDYGFKRSARGIAETVVSDLLVR